MNYYSPGEKCRFPLIPSSHEWPQDLADYPELTSLVYRASSYHLVPLGAAKSLQNRHQDWKLCSLMKNEKLNLLTDAVFIRLHPMCAII